MIFQRARLKTTSQINIYIWKITIVNHGSYGVNQLFLNHQAQLPPRWIRIHWIHRIHRIHLPPRPAICGGCQHETMWPCRDDIYHPVKLLRYSVFGCNKCFSPMFRATGVRYPPSLGQKHFFGSLSSIFTKEQG